MSCGGDCYEGALTPTAVLVKLLEIKEHNGAQMKCPGFQEVSHCFLNRGWWCKDGSSSEEHDTHAHTHWSSLSTRSNQASWFLKIPAVERSLSLSHSLKHTQTHTHLPLSDHLCAHQKDEGWFKALNWSKAPSVASRDQKRALSPNVPRHSPQRSLTLRPAVTLCPSPSNLLTLPPVTTDTRRDGWRKGGSQTCERGGGRWADLASRPADVIGWKPQ